MLKSAILERLLPRIDSAPALSGNLSLTEREYEVLSAIARGELSKEIATHLSISEHAVKGQLASMYNKLGSDSRAAAVSAALQRGWLPPALRQVDDIDHN